MVIQKEKDLYLAELLEQEAITQDEFKDLVFKPEINAFHSNYLSSRFMDNINFGWSAWQAAKASVPEFEIGRLNNRVTELLDERQDLYSQINADAQAVPEGFVSKLKTTMENHYDRLNNVLHEEGYNDKIFGQLMGLDFVEEVIDEMIEAQEQKG